MASGDDLRVQAGQYRERWSLSILIPVPFKLEMTRVGPGAFCMHSGTQLWRPHTLQAQQQHSYFGEEAVLSLSHNQTTAKGNADAASLILFLH